LLSLEPVNGHKVIFVDLFKSNAKSNKDFINTGHIVVCYISGGTVEAWRYKCRLWIPLNPKIKFFWYRPDVKENLETWKAVSANKLLEFKHETWLDITKLELIKPLMMNVIYRFKFFLLINRL
jgi:hypothetical protein